MSIMADACMLHFWLSQSSSDTHSRFLQLQSGPKPVALLMMNFSKSGKTVDESRAWLKRIVITWAILNGLGFIMAYITPFFAGGKWNG